MGDQREPANPRARRRREQRRLFILVAGFVLVGGGAIIALAYGSRAVVLGATCLLAGVGILTLLWVVLVLVERWVE
ncbi:MAG: hypothetical protein PVJ55_07645 [Anaerolineae bacterium]|jgi:hypothetical protein